MKTYLGIEKCKDRHGNYEKIVQYGDNGQLILADDSHRTQGHGLVVFRYLRRMAERFGKSGLTGQFANMIVSVGELENILATAKAQTNVCSNERATTIQLKLYLKESAQAVPEDAIWAHSFDAKIVQDDGTEAPAFYKTV